jgi:hypothetical protein
LLKSSANELYVNIILRRFQGEINKFLFVSHAELLSGLSGFRNLQAEFADLVTQSL